jgi:lysozyme family protein
MKKMDAYTFQNYLDNNDIESILANGGDDLTKSQLEQVKSLGKQLSQMKLDAQRMKLATQPGYAESVLVPLQRKILEQSGNMNYAQAAKIRKKGFADLMTDKLTSGQDTFSSTRSALSDRSKARSMGLKEKFDPLNIAKVLTGGSNIAPAILGRLLGRNKSDIKYFSGKKEYTPRRESSYFNNYTPPSMSSGGSQKATRVLEKMLSFMEKSRTDDMQEQDTLDSFKEMNENMREDRHKEVMDVFIEATKVRRKAMKHMAKEAKKRPAREKAETKKETKPAKTEPKTEATPAKTEAPPSKAEAPKTQPKTEAPPTVKPVETAPPAPTAAPAPPITTPKLPMVKPAATEAAKTAAKVGVGVAGMATMNSAIGGAESGGNYDVSYGDSLDKKTGKMVNRAKDPKTGKPLNLKTPEEFSGKKLTEMTLSEVKAFGEYRSQNGAGAGAVGKYQFMPSTLFGRKNKKGEFVPGLVQQLKKPMSSLFNETLQDELQNALRAQDVATLKRLGVPITPGYEYMAHYIGAGGAAAVFNSINRGEDKTVAQVMIDSGYAVGNNQELYKLRAIEFEKTLQGRLEKKGGLTPHSEANSVGEKANTTSKENTDMRKDMSQGSAGGSPVIFQNNNTTKAKTNIHRVAPKEELNPTMR